MTNDIIRDKIEALMGWKQGASTCFSLRTLQAFVRGKDEGFDRELSLYLDRGTHFFVTEKKKPRRY